MNRKLNYQAALSNLVSRQVTDEEIMQELKKFPADFLRTALNNIPHAMHYVTGPHAIVLEQLGECIERHLKNRVAVLVPVQA